MAPTDTLYKLAHGDQYHSELAQHFLFQHSNSFLFTDLQPTHINIDEYLYGV